ncbi:MAG TPA: polysaccharide biosynthesis/export family protein [Terriglobales bacterium]|nr:polysaccharide biosynthesis/export family protein [Terriglobales bacterium]
MGMVNKSAIYLLGLALLSSLPFARAQVKSESQVPSAAPAQATRTDAKIPETPSATSELPIGSGDLVVVNIYGVQDFKQETRVSNSGEISLPLIGALHVAGLSPAQASSLIAQKLVDGNFYKNPQVSVLVSEYSTEGVYVLGEVQKPGFYSILKARNLLQAISLAGGTTPKAARRVTISNPNRPQKQIVATLAGQADTKQESPDVLPGDTIVVEKAGVVYVVGDVRLPSGIVLENDNLTVLQAIALAQGTNPTAALNKAKLIRRTAQGPEQRDLPLKRMLALQKPDVRVQAEDIIFVPTSATKAFSKRGMEAILQAATGVAMYSRY